ncbi:hypothetical protein GGR56DRAFT_172839 [Xylariaceae sp. FL0804]|nr:hypothetical protein GGR56DRAFT_172839 [Xylariaceae sp. FL0804]
MSDGESDDDAKRTSKKRKASRACDRCNSQHQPCDNAAPKCGVCVRAGTECTYNRPVRKRGPRSGYTGQNGERLWAVVLQSRPEIEDVVLQILRSGTYGDTGISNLDYFRNNDNQTELVSQFNRSRLGRFLQNGETPDLKLPPLDQELPTIVTRRRGQSDGSFGQPASVSNHPGESSTGQKRRHLSESSGSASHAGIVNPHGAPQNPGDIYLQSEDIRRNVFNPVQNQIRGTKASPPRQSPPPSLPVDSSPVPMTVPRSTTFSTNGSAYAQAANEMAGNEVTKRRDSFRQQSNPQRPTYQAVNPAPMEQGQFVFGLADTSRWLDSVPTATLLNLGFMPGAGMAEDFLELCENPDPVDSAQEVPADQHEDEEDVWRRLVMRGRFV